MKYRQLGSSELKVSEIGLGCMSLGSNYQDNEAILHQAFDTGINLFDTADLYQKGENEEHVGRALKDRRDKIILATKVGNQWKPNGSGWDWNPSKSYILKAVDDSLRRLQTDYIDLYQLHGGTTEDPIDETIEAFEELVSAGKIRYYGISSIRPNVIRTYIQRSNISSDMLQYSILDRRSEESVLDLMNQHQKGVLVRGALAKGLLAGKTAQAFLEHSAEQVSKVQDVLKSISSKERSSGQTAIKYVLAHPATTTVVVGASNVQQVIENAGASHAEALTEDEIQALREASLPSVYEKHR